MKEGNNCWNSFEVEREKFHELLVLKGGKPIGRKDIYIDKTYHDGCSVIIGIPPENVKPIPVKIEDFILDVNLGQCAEKAEWIIKQLEVIDEKVYGHTYKEIIEKINTVIGAINTEAMRGALENLDTAQGLSALPTQQEIDEFLEKIEHAVSKNLKEIVEPLSNIKNVLSELKNQNDETSKLMKDILCKVNIGISEDDFRCLAGEVKKFHQGLLTLQNENKELYGDYVNKLKEIRKDIEDNAELVNGIVDLNKKVNEEIGKLKTRVKRVELKLWIVALFLLCATSITILYFNLGNTTTWIANHLDYEWACEWAYRAGDNDVIYNYACRLEKEGKLQQATYFYNKYKQQAEKDTVNIDNTYRLALMYLRGKGGVIDLDKATKYARLSVSEKYGNGLYAYICAIGGRDDWNAITQINISDECGKTNDEYIILARCVMELWNDKVSVDEKILLKNIKILDGLFHSECYPEVLFVAENLYAYGIWSKKQMTTIGGCIVKSIAACEELDNQYNSVYAQLKLGTIYLVHPTNA